jgi:hypothetical protein
MDLYIHSPIRPTLYMSTYKELGAVIGGKNVDRHINGVYLDHYTMASFKHT